MLTKIKKTNPEVFYWVAYAGDTTLLMKQAKELDFNPKLFLSVAINFPPIQRISWGRPGIMSPASTSGSPAMKLPETVKWMEKFNKAYPGRTPEYWAPLAYTNLMTVVDAIKRAGSTDKDKLIAAMEKTDYNSPMGKMTFKKSEEGGTASGHRRADHHPMAETECPGRLASRRRPRRN